MGELVFLTILVMIGIVMYIISGSFPTSIIDKSGGPALFPRLVIIFLFVMIILRIMEILKVPKEERKEFHFVEIFKGSRLIFLVVTFAYYMLAVYLGFVISSIIYLIFMTSYFYKVKFEIWPSKRRFFTTSGSIVLSVVVIDYLFCEVLNVLLPIGIIGF